MCSSNIGGLFNCATSIIVDSIIPVLFSLAVALFVWGVVKFFLINSDEEAKRTQGKQFMIWGILALVVMLSVWGIVQILGSTFGTTDNSGFVIPGTAPSSDPGGQGGGQQCGNGPACVSPRVCNSGTCVLPSSGSCGTGPACHPLLTCVNGQCVPPTTQCTPGEPCGNGGQICASNGFCPI